MIHILLYLITDKLIRFIINLHFVWIPCFERLCPIIHPGHQYPTVFSLIRLQPRSICKRLCCSFFRNRLTTSTICYCIIHRNFFNKNIDILCWNFYFCVLMQIFHFSQKRYGFIMPPMIQSHLGLIICRDNRPCTVFIFINNIIQTSDSLICHILRFKIRYLNHMILKTCY